MALALLGLLLRGQGLALRHPGAEPGAGAEPAAGAEHQTERDRFLEAHNFLEPVVVACGGRKRTFPASMILIDGKALWCPNAKVATTSLYKVMLARIGLHNVPEGIRCRDKCPSLWKGIEAISQVPAARHQELCDAYSFTFVRNPWDRLRSAFQDKVLEANRTGGYYGGHLEKSDGTTEFEKFIRMVGSNPDADVHFMPFDSRCRTNSFNYSFIGRLEDDFDEHVHEVFAASGLDFQTSASASSSAAAQVLARVDARQPVVVPHAQDSGYESRLRERRDAYLLDDLASPRELVNRVAEIYAMDIEPFGYSFKD